MCVALFFLFDIGHLYVIIFWVTYFISILNFYTGKLTIQCKILYEILTYLIDEIYKESNDSKYLSPN